jgi:hypothetical protein
LTVFQFSQVYLPEKFYYLTNHYVSPWFYQNWKVFAPEPPTMRRLFVYRIQENGQWTTWQNPSFYFLQKHWSNRFSSASEMHDMIEALADNIVFTAERSDANTFDENGQWTKLPAYQSAKRFVNLQHPESDSMQFAVLVEHHIIHKDDFIDAYTLYPFQKVDSK